MSLFAIGDLHLSLNSPKSMEVFKGWERYTERIEYGFKETLTDEDTVVIAGDFSWGMTLEESLLDFKFLNALPGKKLIMKGNHDFWWTTRNKMDRFLEENNLNTISFLHNDCYFAEGVAICGTRGWINEDNSAFKENDKKVLQREAGRLKLSLNAAGDFDGEKIVFLHYPPLYCDGRAEEILAVLKEYNIKRCFYGHIHSTGAYYAPKGIYDSVEYNLVSADYLGFKPIKVI